MCEKSKSSLLQDKCVRAGARYLSQMGYDVLERAWSCPEGEIDLVAREGETLVFLKVEFSQDVGGGFPDASMLEERARWEVMAARYLVQSDLVDVPVRFDMLKVLVVGDDRAFLRHHIGALASGELV